MKITTLEQLSSTIERIDKNYLSKSDAASTYALQNAPIVLDTTPATVNGGIWIEKNSDTGVEYLAVNRLTGTFYIPLLKTIPD